MPKDIWMAVHPNGARTQLTSATTEQEASRLLVNAFGLEGVLAGIRLEYGPDTLLNQMMCDFCCRKNVKAGWRYPCEPFVVGIPDKGALGTLLVNESTDDWLACTECHDAYEGGGREALITHAVKAMMSQHPGLTEEMLSDRIRPAYEQFELMRCGEPVAVNKE